MTAFCGGGTSSKKTISPGVVFLSGEALTAVVAAGLELPPVWAALIAFAAAQSFDLNTFCASDPPTLIWPTGPEILDIMSLNVFQSPDAFAHLGSVVANGVWLGMCQCDGTTTPTAPTVPSYPSSAPVTNPSGFSNTTGGPCWDRAIAFDLAHTSAPYDMKAAFPAGVTTISRAVIVGQPPIFGQQIPAGASNLRYSWSTSTAGTKTSSNNAQVQFWNSSGSPLGACFIDDTSTSSQTDVACAIPSGSFFWDAYVSGNVNAGAVSWTFEAKFDCPGQSTGSVQAPCCPPDPTMLGLLQQIYNLLLATYSTIPSRPPTYTASTAHTGLTGGGNFSVPSTTIALKLEVTQLPAVYGQIDGFPQTHIDIGWITPTTLYGPEAGIRVTRTTQVIQLPEATTGVDWSLPPGEEMTITELEAG